VISTLCHVSAILNGEGRGGGGVGVNGRTVHPYRVYYKLQPFHFYFLRVFKDVEATGKTLRSTVLGKDMTHKILVFCHQSVL
jgi:hypothetical protein